MTYILGATTAGIAIDVAFAFGGFFLGFLGCIAYSRIAGAGAQAVVTPPPVVPLLEPSPNSAARANMAAQQLRDLAQTIASDVGAHNTFVEGIADQLGSLDAADANTATAVMGVVAQILEGNDKLQTRLADAEQKIQVQAEEIRNQQSEARTDSLTQLANRRAFDSSLEENLRIQATSSRTFSMMLLDVDHFKQFNDSHGHLAGDEVLRCVARTLAKTVKTGDLACRYGGEEFAIIMANTKAPEAQIAVERVRKAIEGLQVNFGGKTLRVTASIGMAESQPDEDGVRLVRRADDAVYASKKAGRNCSHWHNGEQFLPITNSPQPAKATEAPKPPLTGPTPSTANLPSRAIFTDELRRRVAESQRFGMPLSVIQFRVKDYLQLENTYGEGVGALLLDALAIFIRSTLRDMDLLGKLDDGQFVVMLPGSSASAAKIVGQRVKASISLCPIPLGDQQIRLHLDMGVAEVTPEGDASSTMAAAEASMEDAATAEMCERAAELATA